MSLAPLHGHADARRALARALARGRLTQSLLIHGGAGIGKQRLALWLGQLLLCEAPADEPCGSCVSCRAAARLEHPDLHWFFPLPRPDAASPERLREQLEEARAEELQARRENPAHVPSYEKPPAYYVAAMHTVQEAAVRRPAVGRRKVFVFGDAERMVPQESSPEAANALLKLLEEPPADTTLILTSSVPDELLPTIRSRVLPVRLLPLTREEVAAYLTAHAATPAPEAERLAARASGAIGEALRLLSGDGAEGGAAATALDLLRAALSADPTARLAAAHTEAPSGGRGDFLDRLDALALLLRDVLAYASASSGDELDEARREELSRVLGARRPDGPGVLRALERVLRARELALGNVNPQLILAELLRGVQAELAARVTA